MTAADPVVRLTGAAAVRGGRTLWSGLELDVAPGEFLTVLGPNGSGKSTLLEILLGLLPSAAGEVRLDGAPPRRGSPVVGYVPQQQTLDPLTPLRGRDLVGLGLDGHRWGPGWRGARARRAQVDAALAAVGAAGWADVPAGRLSGGEQQRLRVAQALVGDPRLLLTDEPLLSLDLAHQRSVVEMIDRRRRDHDTAVVFVTHEINPVLPVTDRVLYLVDGCFRIGTPDEVMTSQNLTELYGTQVDVVRVRDRILVVGAEDAGARHDAGLEPLGAPA
jgi:zinc/manganese transport system ATP-binding protein